MTNNLRDALEAALSEQQTKEDPIENKEVTREELSEADNDSSVEDSHELESSQENDAEKPSLDDDGDADEKEDEIAPLGHWNENDKSVFNSLTRDGKELIIRRHKEMEASFTKKNQTLSDEIKFSKSIKEALDPFQDYLKQSNLNPTDAIKNLLAVERELRTAPTEKKQKLIRDLAISYGIQFNAPSEYEGEQERSDPQQQAILDEVFRVKEELRKIQTERVQSESSYLQNMVDDFSSSRDGDGKLKYPHFEELKTDMSMLLEKGRASNLEQAYEQAIYLNNDLRKNHIMRQYSEQRRLEDKKTKSEASKRAGFNIKSKGGTISDDNKPTDIRDILSRTYDEQLSNYS